MKVYHLVGWLVGLAAGALAFSTVGVLVLFPFAWAFGHGGSRAVFLGATVLVIAACLWLAYGVHKGVVALALRRHRATKVDHIFE